MDTIAQTQGGVGVLLGGLGFRVGFGCCGLELAVEGGMEPVVGEVEGRRVVRGCVGLKEEEDGVVFDAGDGDGSAVCCVGAEAMGDAGLVVGLPVGCTIDVGGEGPGFGEGTTVVFCPLSTPALGFTLVGISAATVLDTGLGVEGGGACVGAVVDGSGAGGSWSGAGGITG